jgi:hypothetical protein
VDDEWEVDETDSSEYADVEWRWVPVVAVLQAVSDFVESLTDEEREELVLSLGRAAKTQVGKGVGWLRSEIGRLGG